VLFQNLQADTGEGVRASSFNVCL